MNSKLDWPNHIIAFFSALLGILIAFQLEDFRDNRKDTEELQSALNSIKAEINNNLEIYEANVNQLGEWLDYWELIKGHDEDGFKTIAKKKYEKLKAKIPNRYSGTFKFIDDLNDTTIVIQANSSDIMIDVIPKTGITVSSWTAILNSGLLNKLPYDVVMKLSQIYEWIEKDLGVSDREILVLKDITKEEGYDDLNLIVAFNYKVRNVHEFKLEMVKRIFDEMELK